MPNMTRMQFVKTMVQSAVWCIAGAPLMAACRSKRVKLKPVAIHVRGRHYTSYIKLKRNAVIEIGTTSGGVPPVSYYLRGVSTKNRGHVLEMINLFLGFLNEGRDVVGYKKDPGIMAPNIGPDFEGKAVKKILLKLKKVIMEDKPFVIE